MKLIFSQIAALISGICASMGLGGGAVLILYLTLFESADQLYSQGINLIFFIPIALVSSFKSIKAKIYKISDILVIVLFGAASCIIGLILAFYLKSRFVSKAFGIFLLISGAKEALSILKGIKKRKK